jgi:hypothetical protein
MFVLSSVCPAAGVFLTPSGAVSGQPGDFAGWGYSLTESDGYAVPTFSEFNPAPGNGLYVDFVVQPSNFVVVAPSVPGGQDFDAALFTGIGEFFIDPSTPAGTIINGTITLHYDLYSADPNVDPGSFLSGDNTVPVDASILVTAAPVASPEPGTFGLVVVVGLVGRRRKTFRRWAIPRIAG